MGMAGSSTPQAMGMVGSVMPQLPYGLSAFQTGQVPGSGGGGAGLPPTSPSQLAPHQLAFQQMHRQQLQQQQLQKFWEKQYDEIEQTVDFKNHSLPLARIKKIMKADEDVRMISAEAPVIFAKACEMFILELTLRSWNHTEENKRRTLQKNDIAAAITRTEIFDFLVDIVPREDLKDDPVIPDPMLPGGPVPESFPYYYMPPPPAPPQHHPPLLANMPSLDDPPIFSAHHGLPFSPQQHLWLQQQQQQQQQQPQSPSDLWADPHRPDHET